MSGLRVFPFIPTDMNETQYGNWNAVNKSKWLGPFTIEQALRVYWDAKNIKISISASTHMFSAVIWNWNGSSWTVWPPGDAPPPTVFNFPAGGVLALPALKRPSSFSPPPFDYADSPENFVCSASKTWLAATPIVDTVDARFRWDNNESFFFGDGTLNGTGITSFVFMARRVLTEEYWIPFRLFLGFSTNPAVVLINQTPGSTTPAPPTRYGSATPGFPDYDFAWNCQDAATSGNNRPALNWSILGVSGTHLYNSSGQTTIATFSCQLTIDEFF